MQTIRSCNPLKELNNCTFAKTILMLVVVLGHCFDFWTGSWFTADPVFQAPILGIIADYCNSFHIFAFTLISGYIFSYIRWEKAGYKSFHQFISNKFRRLIVPYIFTAIIWIVPITNLFYDWSIEDNISRFVLCTSPAQLWFLWMLFDVFIIAWILSNVLKNDHYAIVLSLISFAIGFVVNRVLPNVFCVWTAFLYLPFFVLGMKLREHKEKGLRQIPWYVFTVTHIIIFFVCEFMSTKEGIVFLFLTKGLELVMHLAGALSAFFVLQHFANKHSWENNQTVSFLTVRSMPIYLFHQQVIYVVLFFLNGRVNPYVNSVVNIIATFLVSILIASFLIRFKATRILVGEK